MDSQRVSYIFRTHVGRRVSILNKQKDTLESVEIFLHLCLLDRASSY